MTTVTAKKSNLISPNHLQERAITMMLDGREPSSREDWVKLANFWAFNIKEGLEVAITKLMGKLYSCPLSEADLVAIGEHQARVKARGLEPGRTYTADGHSYPNEARE